VEKNPGAYVNMRSSSMHKKILFIEDEKIVRENIVSLLSEEGYTVLSSNDGKNGVKIAKKELPDLIICDIMMEGMDGYEVLRELSGESLTKSIPFIFLTAKVEREDIRHGMNLGADDYLFKPFDAEDLLSSIDKRLKRIESLKADFDIHNEGPKTYTVEDKIFVQVNNKTHFITISEISYITAEKQYSAVNLSDGKSYLLRKSLSVWEKLLPEKKFLRIHRSTIINIDYLVKMETWYNSSFILYLKNVDKPFIISRRYSMKLRGKLFK
jgi:DNA-binding LytR/AlgR family response regulator